MTCLFAVPSLWRIETASPCRTLYVFKMLYVSKMTSLFPARFRVEAHAPPPAAAPARPARHRGHVLSIRIAVMQAGGICRILTHSAGRQVMRHSCPRCQVPYREAATPCPQPSRGRCPCLPLRKPASIIDRAGRQNVEASRPKKAKPPAGSSADLVRSIRAVGSP
jgi:hypothetical protein